MSLLTSEPFFLFLSGHSANVRVRIVEGKTLERSGEKRDAW